jgi:hypothetical protein
MCQASGVPFGEEAGLAVPRLECSGLEPRRSIELLFPREELLMTTIVENGRDLVCA